MSLQSEIERIARLRPLLVGVDFDGTITPIVDDPARARPDRSAREALTRLAGREEVSVAVVSGRRRQEVLAMLEDPSGVTVIGEHGSDTGDPHAGTPDLGELVAELEDIASDVPGSWVEAKVWSVVFHYRLSDPDLASDGVRRVLEGPGSRRGVVARQGNMVVELHATETNKGDAVEALRKATGAAAVVFIGDDVTDEEAFARLGEADLGIKVGPGPTAAGHRVRNVDQVAQTLHRLADAL